MTTPSYHPPLLHDLLVSVSAPSALLSAPSGEIDAQAPGGGGQGLFHGDTRALSQVRLRVDGLLPYPVLAVHAGPGQVALVSLPRNVGPPPTDPTVRLDRTRELRPGRFTEAIVVSSIDAAPISAVVRIELGTDLQPVGWVKSGQTASPIVPREGPDGELEWSNRSVRVRAAAPGATTDLAGGGFEWKVELAPGGSVALSWTVGVDDGDTLLGPAPTAGSWARPQVRAGDHRLVRLLEQALDDLHGLRMATLDAPGDVFLAAGAPWFFTLFGRDSMWAARMMLPLGTDLARGTLRVLARLQGSREEPATEQEPGKILHELRGGDFEDGAGLRLPPVYYGTVDATPLWVCLLHDAWRWGLPAADVEELLPNLEAALAWMERAVDNHSGFLVYEDRTGAGLANQGWKDSGDAIRFRSGRLATPPVALSEVQGYAHEAALSGAALLDAFGRPGGDRWRAWAALLADRFRTAFWTADEYGPFPAMALDRSGEAVDAAASNMGHLLGTGLLDEQETELVARRLTEPDLADAYGLRTMSSRANGYSALSYHCGSVWPHDTAIVISGLARSGHGHRTGELIQGVLAASETFGGRLPELWSGDARHQLPAPVPYPAACRPQAWSAATAVCLLTAILGLHPTASGGQPTLRPISPSPVGRLSVRGLRLAGVPFDVEIAADGTAFREHT